MSKKTEVLLCGPSSRRKTVPVDCLSVGEASIPFSNVVKTLGVTLDAELSMEQHISTVVGSCFFHIRSLSKVCPYITYKAASCLILSKLDYYSHLLSGVPPKQIKHLQAVQNAAARTVMKCKNPRSHHSHSYTASLASHPETDLPQNSLCHLPGGQLMITSPLPL